MFKFGYVHTTFVWKAGGCVKDFAFRLCEPGLLALAKQYGKSMLDRLAGFIRG